MDAPLIPDPSLPTESVHPRHSGLDLYATPELVGAFVDDQVLGAQAVQAAAPMLARAVDAAWPRLRAGGRLLYAGAGTSGRLGVLDGAELPPTFSWPAERAVGLLAGGAAAMFAAVEGAEDNRAQGAADLAALTPTRGDVVVLVAASGGTPFTLGVLDAAKAAGALTIGIVNNVGTPLGGLVDIAVVLDTGPEVLSGSTRLKAGTAQKIALNALSSALMVRMNKVYGNLMVDLRATNTKLRLRAVNLTMRATGASEADVLRALGASGDSVKVAIVMLARGLDAVQAQQRLAGADGSVRKALA